MNDAQRREFAEKGYLIIPNVLSPEAVADLNAEYDARLAPVHDSIAAEAAAGKRTGTGGFGLQLHRDGAASRAGGQVANVTDRHGNYYAGTSFW